LRLGEATRKSKKGNINVSRNVKHLEIVHKRVKIAKENVIGNWKNRALVRKFDQALGGFGVETQTIHNHAVSEFPRIQEHNKMIIVCEVLGFEFGAYNLSHSISLFL
jgi:predicted nucleic acid-binding protein